MHPKESKWLEDVRVSAHFILEKTQGRSLADYRGDDLLRAGVERHFEIIGEALNRLRQKNPRWATDLPDCAQFVAFRNVLIHGYDIVDDVRVWDAITVSLPALLREVEGLLGGH